MAKQSIASELLETLACLVCKSGVELVGAELIYVNDGRRPRFPVIDEIPIMLAQSSNHRQDQK